MKKILLGLGILFLGARLYAGTDRFGNSRYEIPKTSYTESVDVNVVIASAPEVNTSTAMGGAMFIRAVNCSGVVSSTITFYDANLFTALTSTANKYIFLGVAGDGGTRQYTQYFSSGIMYNKQGLAPCSFSWDYTTAPKWGGVGLGK